MTAPQAVPREERRRRTEAAIVDAARALFAELGYERTTIRGVASRAGVDPALVMQYFGNKEGLFKASARWLQQHETIFDATSDTLGAAALADMFAKFEDSDERESAVALMRACLTHPTATAVIRDEVMCDRAAHVAAAIGGDDAELRAGLVAACMMGLGMARYLIELPAVATASRDDIARVLQPALQVIVSGTVASGTAAKDPV